ncbi:LysM peptidoglycan-binding domain-containing protein [Candidatus Poribacteria bacterium]|nr:LysM peptidoglycan-binding domain-containing protein [Candidatus Poribacteria bacterium]
MSIGGPEIIAKEMAVSIQAKIPVSIKDKTKPDPKRTIKKPRDEILKIVIVVKNDTLWSITKNNYGKASKEMLKAIQEFNPEISDTDKIYVGQKIKLPDMENKIITKKHQIKSKLELKAVTVKPDDNLFRIVLNNYGTVSQKLYDAIMKANPHIISITIIKVGQKITLPDIQTRGPV